MEVEETKQTKKERVKYLSQLCQAIGHDEKELDKNKNFWAVNMHGAETNEKYVIPRGVRIIMFCYSGRELFVCPRFDKFNWKEIFLNKDACFNYCTFLATLASYSSLRDHFCIYEEGDKLTELYFRPDEEFRSGIYQLPVEAMALDEKKNRIYTSSDTYFSTAVEAGKGRKKVSVNTKDLARIIKDRNTPVVMFTPNYVPQGDILLSEVVEGVKSMMNGKGFTLFLVTCRSAQTKGFIKTKRLNIPTVMGELEKLYEQYSKEI